MGWRGGATGMIPFVCRDMPEANGSRRIGAIKRVRRRHVPMCAAGMSLCAPPACPYVRRRHVHDRTMCITGLAGGMSMTDERIPCIGCDVANLRNIGHAGGAHGSMCIHGVAPAPVACPYGWRWRPCRVRTRRRRTRVHTGVGSGACGMSLQCVCTRRTLRLCSAEKLEIRNSHLRRDTHVDAASTQLLGDGRREALVGYQRVNRIDVEHRGLMATAPASIRE